MASRCGGVGGKLGAIAAVWLFLVRVAPSAAQTPPYPAVLDTLRGAVGDSVAGRVNGYQLLSEVEWHRDMDAAVRAWEGAGIGSSPDGGCLRTPRPPMPRFPDWPGGIDGYDGILSVSVLTRWGELFEPVDRRCPHAPPSDPVASPRALAEGFRLELEAFRRVAEEARRSERFEEEEYWGWIVLYRVGIAIYRDYFDDPAREAGASTPGVWERLPDLPYPVRAPAVATDGERVYVFGGSAEGNVRGAHTQIFDPASSSWTAGASMPEPVEWSSAAYARGRFHVLGGVTDRSAAVPTHWIYDPGEDAWVMGPTMSSPAAGAAAVPIDGRIIVVGGIDGPASYSARVRVYNLDSGVWEERTQGPVASINWQGAAIDGLLWVAGGSGPGRVTSDAFYSYAPAFDTWITRASLPRAIEGYGGAEVGGRYCTVGGRITPRSGSFNTPYPLVFCYEPVQNRWSRQRLLPTAVEEVGAVGLDGALYAIGGRISYAGVSGTMYRLAF